MSGDIRMRALGMAAECIKNEKTKPVGVIGLEYCHPAQEYFQLVNNAT